MATSIKPCTATKCEMSSCALCHCCEKNLCLDHLKEHRDLLNAQLIPLAHQVNTFMEHVDRFEMSSAPAFQTIEQWRQQAHQVIDTFCQKMQKQIIGNKKDKSKEDLQTVHTTLEQIIRKHGATRENLESVTKSLNTIQQQLTELSKTQVNLRPLVLDENSMISTDPVPTPNSNRQKKQTKQNNNQQSAPLPVGDLADLINGSAFQIFVQFNGQTHTLVVARNDSILQIKQNIQRKLGIEPENQCLNLMGKILRDQHSVALVGIGKHTTLHLSVFLKADPNQKQEA